MDLLGVICSDTSSAIMVFVKKSQKKAFSVSLKAFVIYQIFDFVLLDSLWLTVQVYFACFIKCETEKSNLFVKLL